MTARKYYCFEYTPVRILQKLIPNSVATVRAEYEVKWYSVNTYPRPYNKDRLILNSSVVNTVKQRKCIHYSFC